MAPPATRDLINLARQAGYRVVETQQPRPNRWVFAMATPDGRSICLLVQARPVIGAADVHDIAELIRLRGFDYGILLAHGGRFGEGAFQAHAERRDVRLLLCTTLPPHNTNPDHTAAPSGTTLQPRPEI